MIHFKRPVVLGVVASLALSVFAVATPAFADPVTDSFAAVGSDTLQDSMNALVNGTAVSGAPVRIKADGQAIGNFDAFGSAKIQTKPNKALIDRPSGSGAGVTALLAAISAGSGQIDIARSSAGPTAPLTTGTLAWVPYARDAVSYAYVDNAGELASLTKAQLKSIYEANNPTTINGVVVKPLIPQDQSGTRKFYLAAIGVTTMGSQVKDTITATANTLPENDGSVLTQVGQIVPFSAASWIAQSNGAAPSTLTTTAAKLGNLDGIAPYTGTGTALLANPTFYSSSFGRDTFLVVEAARIKSTDSKYDAVLAALVNPTVTSSLTDFSAAGFKTRAGAVKLKFGFEAPSSNAVLYSNTK
jgi:hypothetical protein